MSCKRIQFLSTVLCLANGLSRGQQATPVDSGAVIKTETRLVVVDTVVTDKKGAYIRDLTAKDFRVWEDKKEQKITTFAFEADPSGPVNSRRYLVLFFDNSTMGFAEQAQARKAAAQFIESNAGPNRMMAIVNFGGSIQLAQNFTDNAERLKAVVTGVKFSAILPNEAPIPGMSQLSRAAADFGARDVILGLRSLAKNLASVEGRKTLILLTAGFRVTPEQMSEITATIDVCNKANVAIYPIDVRGLTTPDMAPPKAELFAPGNPYSRPGAPSVFFQPVVYRPTMGIAMQGRGGGAGGAAGGGAAGGAAGGAGAGAGGGGGRGGGGSVGSPGGSTGSGAGAGTGGRVGGAGTGGTIGNRGGPGLGSNNPNVGRGGMNPNLNPNLNNPARNALIPKFPESSTTNQQLMFMLAEGTGGFVIHDTNDLAGGLDKIGKELNEYYVLGYEPEESPEGSCHTLQVKVNRGGTNIRARTGYCNAKPNNVLAGNPIEKQLESHVTGAQAGNVTASMQTPYFYTADKTARVNVAMEIAASPMKFEKSKGKFHAAVNVLGIAYTRDGAVGARFSDIVKLDFESKKEVEAFQAEPFHYENQFELATGQYNFKVAFSEGGDNFGKIEAPLVVDSYDAKQLGLSGIAFSKDLRRADAATGIEADLIADRTPLIAQGMQLIPSGSNRFKTTDKAALYVEIYEPGLVSPDPQNPVMIALQLKVTDRKTGEKKIDSGLFRIDVPEKSGNPVIPWGFKLPVENLVPGSSYKVEVTAVDGTGKSVTRTADLEIQ